MVGLWQGEGAVYAATGRQLFRQKTPGETFELVALPVPIDGRIVGINGMGPYIWLATTDGVIVYHELGGNHAVFRTTNGLPHNLVYDVFLEDKWAWMVTRDGIARFNWKRYFE